MRTTEIVSAMYGEIPSDWLNMCKTTNKSTKDLTEENVLDWASRFGTQMHGVCLEDKEIEFDKKLAVQCKKQFDLFKLKYAPKYLEVEKSFEKKDEYGDVIYTGTPDLIARIRGKKVLVDLKFWGVWKYKFKYELPKRITSFGVKGAKVNLQTKLYEYGIDTKIHERATLWITPDFYVYKKMARDPTKFDEAIEYAKDNKDKTYNF